MSNQNKYLVSGLFASILFFGGLMGYEGYRAKPYLDTGGIITQGIGSTTKPDGSKIKMSDPPISKETAIEWARHHVAKDEVTFRKSLQGVRLSQQEYDLYLDFMYNFGQSNWRSSSMLRNLKTGKYKAACDALLKYKFVAKRDCSIRSNNCYGVWTRQVERHKKCIAAN